MSTSIAGHHPTTLQGATALRAALAAGRVLKQKFYQTREIQSKGFRDIVTDADFAADRAARRILERSFPDYAIVSEEDKIPPRSTDFVWLMDPLDGTTNYARRIPIFSVSLALTHRGQPLVGVVYDPLRNECFFAERGQGAWLNGNRIHASAIKTLDQAVVGYEQAREPKLRALGLKLFQHFSFQSITARLGGSAALSLCYVGAGRLDVYFQPNLFPWDVAAGILIVREGGGRAAHFDGKPATLKGGAYCAANRALFPEFIKQMKTVQGSLS